MPNIPIFSKKPAGKIAMTGYVNKVVDFAAGLAAPFQSGTPENLGRGYEIYWFRITKLLSANWAIGTEKLGPALLSENDTDAAAKMQDGDDAFIFIPEGTSFAAGDLVASAFLGFRKNGDEDFNAAVFTPIGAKGSSVRVVPVTSSTGSPGDDSSECALAYTFTVDGVEYTTVSMSGHGRRDPIGTMTQGTKLIVFKDGTTWKPVYADEQQQADECLQDVTSSDASGFSL